MSSENEGQSFPDKVLEEFDESAKKPKITYSRDFLLSLSDLDICKKLPSGFDESLLSEFEDSSQGLQERPRIPGSFQLQGFRRDEYGSSPPTRGDSGNYSRFGRWESRSAVRSDRDSDSQSDRDSDSGRRYTNPARRSWHAPEHDGLLGSGSSAKTSGYAVGTSGPKSRANEHGQLNLSNEPYHPPRPYKAVPHHRRDTDAFNDETFGSKESTTEDRIEEEKRRRASFELMRKEQQKALQEKQNVQTENRKAIFSDIGVLEENTEVDEKLFGRDNETFSATKDSEKFSRTVAYKPRVPPGFTNSNPEKSLGTKSSTHSSLSEVGESVTGHSTEANAIQDGQADSLGQQLPPEIDLGDLYLQEMAKNDQPLDKGENVDILLSLDATNKTLGINRTNPQVGAPGILDGPETIELNAKALDNNIILESMGSRSTSILGKSFGSTSSVNGGRFDSAEHQDSKVDDTWSQSSAQSSKFAQWFSVEEAKADDEVSSSRPNDLLSLIVSGDKSRNLMSSSEAAADFPHDFSYKSLDVPSALNEVTGQVYIGKEKGAASTFLTCEDLEQSLLSEYNANTPNWQPKLREQVTSTNGANTVDPRPDDEDQASQSLLSLLQKGTGLNTGNLIADSARMDSKGKHEECGNGTALNDSKGKQDSNIANSLTLETLFGTAFMKELQSVKAPVSVQRGSGSAPDSLETSGLSSSFKENDIGFQQTDHDSHNSATDNNWLSKLGRQGSGEPQIELKRGGIAVSGHGGLDGVFGFLPGEETILSRAADSNEIFSSNAPVHIDDNLAAFGARVSTGPDGRLLRRDSREQVDPQILYHNLQPQQPSQFQSPPQMIHGRPSFNPSNPYPPYMKKFMGPETKFNQEFPINYQPGNMFHPPVHQPNAGISGFDRPMLHQMPMSGNPPRLMPDFPRSVPVPHPGLQVAGFNQEIRPMQHFPYGPRPSNMENLPMMPPGPDTSSSENPSDAFKRLIEMELRAKAKQVHPYPPGHNQGIHMSFADRRQASNELDMGFRYNR